MSLSRLGAFAVLTVTLAGVTSYVSAVDPLFEAKFNAPSGELEGYGSSLALD